MVSAGQSSLHFNSGSFELMGYDENHRPVENPLEAMKGLDEEHPTGGWALTTWRASPTGGADARRCRSQNAGNRRAQPLETLPDGSDEDRMAHRGGPYRPRQSRQLSLEKAAIINITGLLDFFPRFLETGLRKRGMECSLAEVTCNEIAKQRG